MKIVALSLFTFFTVQSFAQITTTKVIEKPQETKITSYDSVSNFLGKNYEFYKGQTLYLKGLSQSLRKYGYRDFYNNYGNVSSIDKNNIYKCCVDDGLGSKYEELAEKYFEILEILPHPRAKENEYLYAHKHFFKLKEKESGGECYFEYNDKSEYSFPFIVVGYFEKLKKNLVGKEFVTRGKNWIEKESPMTDMKTGVAVSDFNNGKTWKCTDLTIETEYYSLSLILTNAKGEKIPLDVDNLKSNYWVFEHSKAESYKVKFGEQNWLSILKGIVKIGMTEEMCRVAWGEPKKVNHTSSGDQWVYDKEYLYFEGGKLKSFN